MADNHRQTTLAYFMSFTDIKYKFTSYTCAGSDFVTPLPIQAAMSPMLGTVAETSINRTFDPRNFIRDVTTSSVLPRDSLRI